MELISTGTCTIAFWVAFRGCGFLHKMLEKWDVRCDARHDDGRKEGACRITIWKTLICETARSCSDTVAFLKHVDLLSAEQSLLAIQFAQSFTPKSSHFAALNFPCLIAAMFLSLPLSLSRCILLSATTRPVNCYISRHSRLTKPAYALLLPYPCNICWLFSLTAWDADGGDRIVASINRSRSEGS